MANKTPSKYPSIYKEIGGARKALGFGRIRSVKSATNRKKMWGGWVGSAI